MKKLLFLLSAWLLSSFGYAQDLPDSWLETGQSKLNCKKIHLGYRNARIVLLNGNKKDVPISVIHSYSLNGIVYTQLPLYSNGKPTGFMVFMELIKNCGEFGLYKFEERTGPKHLDKKDHYFLYKGNKLNLAFDDKMLPDMNFEFDLASIFLYH